MQRKSTRVICNSHVGNEAAPTPRPERRNPYQITPAAYQEIKIHDAPRPAAVIALDAYDVKIIHEYREAKAAWDKALQAAEASRIEGGTLWSGECMDAVEAATEVLRGCEISMAMLFSHLTNRAGI